jgi:hypothetical protein
VTTAANLGGLALGPPIAGIITEWAPLPLVATQAAFCAVMAVFLVLVLLSPETVESGSARASDRPGSPCGRQARACSPVPAAWPSSRSPHSDCSRLWAPS